MTTHTNQFFSLNRFGNYAASALMLRSRQLLLTAIAVPSGFFLLMTFIMMFNGKWMFDEWISTLMLISVSLGILFIGSSFPALRSKKESISFLMVPASAFEKYLYELLMRLVLYCILFPVVFYVVGNLSLSVADSLRTYMGRSFYNSEYFSFALFKGQFRDIFPLFVAIIVFVYTLFFAGATTFRRMAIVKTLAFVGGCLVTFLGYIGFLNTKFRVKYTWTECLYDGFEHKSDFIHLLCFVFIILSMVALVYAYFKLKEKELK